MCKKAQDNLVELRLIRAFTYMVRAPVGGDGSRTVSLARFGSFEVRLIETHLGGDHPMWLHIYAHHTQSVIASCCCFDLEQVVDSAERFISTARELNDAR